jgi:hypothetical protein
MLWTREKELENTILERIGKRYSTTQVRLVNKYSLSLHYTNPFPSYLGLPMPIPCRCSANFSMRLYPRHSNLPSAKSDSE